MAGIVIPLITEFKDTGIKQAMKEFKALGTAGEKAQFAIKKAAVPAAAALAGVVTVITGAVKAAIEDQAAQALLARQIKASTEATDAQIASVEKYISSLGASVAVSDDEARPAFQALVVATKDLTKAQDLLNIAIDVSAATSTDLTTVSDALAKAYAGNMRGLQTLSPEIKAMVKDGASLEEVLAVLTENFGGAGIVAANTAAGGMKKLGIAFNETKESIGTAFLPVMEKLQPVLEKFATWAQNNPGLLTAVIASMGLLAVSILAVNAAMALNPAVIITAALVAVAVAGYKLGLVIGNTLEKFSFFQTIANGLSKTIDLIKNAFASFINVFVKGMNVLIRGANLIPGINIPTLGGVDFSSSSAPSLSSNDRGMGGAAGQSVNVIVNAGLVSTGAQVGQDIIAAIQKAERLSGQVFAAA